MNGSEFSSSVARPSRRGKLVGVVAVVATLAIALGAAGVLVQLRSAPPAAPQASRTPITKSGAIAAAEGFLGRKLGPADVGEPQDWPGGREVEVRETGSDGADVWVDVSTGKVIRLNLPGAVPETTTVAITADQAQSAAEAFFKDHDIPFDGLTATVKLPSRLPPKAVLLRCRHPKAALIRSVTVNGKEWKDFDAGMDVVRLHDLDGTVTVEARYDR